MPLNYLCTIEASQLPLETINNFEIRHIAKLAAVGLVQAEIKPDFMSGHARGPHSATVLSITKAGRVKIAQLRLGFQETVPGSLT
ncbi:hypothetical protein VLK31_23580 [Variovorax sp. H27-G14]|uniref:hypothetical protein n=1 Tax=Variovorax sp. H27-G14 TaxID=3111914 RepID=UPI0038FC61CE